MRDIDLREDWKKILLIVLALGLVAAFISIVAALAGRPLPEEAPTSAPLPLDTGEFIVRPENLMLPDIPAELWRGIYTPAEKQKRQWGMEELRQFYYDPLEIGAENLRGLNQEKIDRLLKKHL